jgi:hypothetical protein
MANSGNDGSVYEYHGFLTGIRGYMDIRAQRHEKRWSAHGRHGDQCYLESVWRAKEVLAAWCVRRDAG